MLIVARATCPSRRLGSVGILVHPSPGSAGISPATLGRPPVAARLVAPFPWERGHLARDVGAAPRDRPVGCPQ